MERERQLGLFGATALGVGAIVGGGIMALAGVALRGWPSTRHARLSPTPSR